MEVFSTAYLPGTSYVQQYLQAKSPVIDLGENYIKQTHRNRGVICSSNGPLSLIVPLRKLDSRRVADQEISYSENWQQQHVKSIRSCYKNSPYFEHYQPEFEVILNNKFRFLYELNEGLFTWILDQLEIKPKHTTSFEYIEGSSFTDYRNMNTEEGTIRSYKQVFSDRNGFCAGVSCIDLLFNKGPEALAYMQ